jgi:hypothetical protein
MALDSSQFLKKIKNQNPHLGNLLEAWFDQMNTALHQVGVDIKGKAQPPPPIAGLNVAPGTDHVHVTINDPSAINKNVQYIVEYSVGDPSFAQPHQEDLGASRGRVLSLPAKTSLGAAQTYYFRAYSQYFGSDPQSKHAYFGQRGNPTAVTLTGSSQLTLLPSQGSGTGRADGTQGGAGLGFVTTRAVIGPKRSPAPPIR